MSLFSVYVCAEKTEEGSFPSTGYEDNGLGAGPPPGVVWEVPSGTE